LLDFLSKPFANFEQRLSELLLVLFKLEGQAMRTSAVVNGLRVVPSSTLRGKRSPSRATDGSTEFDVVKLAKRMRCVKLAQRAMTIYNMKGNGKSG